MIAILLTCHDVHPTFPSIFLSSCNCTITSCHSSQYRVDRHTSTRTHLFTPNLGIFTLTAKQSRSKEFLDFERAWYSQPSSAIISEKGIRTNCSDAVDATGRYIWRQDGKKRSDCSGIDFEQAGRKWRANQCNNDDIVCRSAAISTYVPFAYDAGIAMAHGLDKLVNRENISPGDITADLLSQAIRSLSFEGASGHVSFLSNGDRRSDHFEYAVYNYHEATRRFEAVGQMVNGNFSAVCEGGNCTSMVFSDGSTSTPVVRVRKSDKCILPSHVPLFIIVDCICTFEFTNLKQCSACAYTECYLPALIVCRCYLWAVYLHSFRLPGRVSTVFSKLAYARWLRCRWQSTQSTTKMMGYLTNYFRIQRYILNFLIILFAATST